MQKKKPNKSSIIRVIISNFDDKQVKEIKVLYTKQGGIDVIKLKSTRENQDGKMIFDSLYAYNMLENEKAGIDIIDEDQSFFIGTNEDETELYITKKHRITDEITKKYTIQGKYDTVKSGDTKVTVSIIDTKDYSGVKDLEDKSRVFRSISKSTNRILLDPEVANNYRQIVCSDSETVDETINIDSQEIYKINKFLSYRSNMIIYYKIINNFLLNYELGEEKGSQGNQDRNLISEIWQYRGKGDYEKTRIIERVYKNIQENINDFIINHNNRVEQENNGEKIDISKGAIEEDLDKVFILFSELRHSIVHYNYTFYQNLYSGKDFVIGNKGGLESRKLSELLDLNIFKELYKIKLIKNNAVSNYLNKKTTINVLNKNINARNLLDIYRDICERKPGFNKFINDMITVDGDEDKQYKKIVNKHFNEKVNSLSNYLKVAKGNNKNLNKVMEEYRKLQEWFAGPYVYDIHSLKKYKELYIKRKNLVTEHSKIIESGINKSNKKRLTEINESLFKLNRDMKEITNLNAKFRLQYKLQLAFGFILEEFDLDISKFGNDFNKDKDLAISEFIGKREIYLNRFLSRGDNRLEKFIDSYEFRDTENIFYSDRDNNLVKLYILMYILLPNDLRGDFLGFVKKNYYDMKHVNFIDKEDHYKRDTFFHDLRLFEKNTRKLQIINYNLSSGFISMKYKEKFEQNFEKAMKNILNTQYTNITDEIDIKEYNNYLILPLMKNYQIIFKLLNDIEISALFKIAGNENTENKGKNNAFKKAIDKVKKGKNINFSQVMKITLNEKELNKDGIYQIRNNIAHINMEQLYLSPLNKYINNNNNSTISERIEKIIDICMKGGITGKELNKDIINDYYMKKERLVFNLNLRKEDDTVSIEKQSKLKRKNSTLERYGLNSKDIDLLKITGKVNDLEKKVTSIKEDSKHNSNKKINLSKDISLLNGIIRKDIIVEVRKIALDMIQRNEYRYVNINIYDRTNKQDYNINLKVSEKILVVSSYDDKCVDGKINSIYKNTNAGRDLFINTHDGKYDIELKLKDKQLIIEFDKDLKNSNQVINLEYKYIQNVKFIVT